MRRLRTQVDALGRQKSDGFRTLVSLVGSLGLSFMVVRSIAPGQLMSGN